jgi:hypothetical protein
LGEVRPAPSTDTRLPLSQRDLEESAIKVPFFDYLRMLKEHEREQKKVYRNLKEQVERDY